MCYVFYMLVNNVSYMLVNKTNHISFRAGSIGDWYFVVCQQLGLIRRYGFQTELFLSGGNVESGSFEGRGKGRTP